MLHESLLRCVAVAFRGCSISDGPVGLTDWPPHFTPDCCGKLKKIPVPSTLPFTQHFGTTKMVPQKCMQGWVTVDLVRYLSRASFSCIFLSHLWYWPFVGVGRSNYLPNVNSSSLPMYCSARSGRPVGPICNLLEITYPKHLLSAFR